MKNKKKLIMALTLGILTLSGFAISAYAMDNTNLNSQQHAIKEIKNNPFDFINSVKMPVPNNFDYIQQLNKEFVGDSFIYRAGDSLKVLEEEHQKLPK